MTLAKRRLTTVIISTALLCGAAGASTLTGHWAGAVERDGAIQMIECDFVDSADVVTGRYSIPELCLFNEPLTEISYTPPALSFHFLYGVFTATVHDSLAEITGANNNWGPPVKIHLKRAAPEHRLRREPIQFTNGPVTLSGSLVLPDSPPPYPAIVVVHGSGPQGLSTWSYRSYADFFARHGWAALVYDKRGVGKSGGDYLTADFPTLAADVVAGVRAIAARDDIDTDRIGLMGISQGGWLAPLAARTCDSVSFVVLDVGPAVSVWQQEKDRIEYSMRRDRLPQADIAAALSFADTIFAAVENPSGSWPALQPLLTKARESDWHEYVQIPESEQDIADWARLRYDPAPVLEETRIPVLAVYGADDVFVPPDRNVPLLRRYLEAAGNRNVTIRVFADVGHDLETGRSLVGDDWSWPDHFWRWSRKAPGYLEALVEWLDSPGS